MSLAGYRFRKDIPRLALGQHGLGPTIPKTHDDVERSIDPSIGVNRDQMAGVNVPQDVGVFAKLIFPPLVTHDHGEGGRIPEADYSSICCINAQ
jgi:hypothetical protein